jgi:hypothetical protein
LRNAHDFHRHFLLGTFRVAHATKYSPEARLKSCR